MTRILVIENEQSIREDVIQILGFEGYEVAGAENGQVGIEQTHVFRPDVVICDIMMPVMDGHAVLLELRSDPSTATLPFVFLTARAQRSDMREGITLGADDYLTKPFTAEELLSAVTTRLERHAVVQHEYEQKLEHLRGSIGLALPHELRTPLTSILGFSEMLMTDNTIVGPDEIYDLAQRINRAGERLYHLVENFLLYSQLQTIKLDPATIAKLSTSQTFDPQLIIEQAATTIADDSKRSSDLAMHVEPVAMITFDSENFKKAVSELISNAFKFSRSGTPVTISGQISGENYQLCVADQGRGMTAQQINNVGAYNQFDRARHEQQGSGLGLMIAKSLIELYGGTLSIDSASGQGSNFCLALKIPKDS